MTESNAPKRSGKRGDGGCPPAATLTEEECLGRLSGERRLYAERNEHMVDQVKRANRSLDKANTRIYVIVTSLLTIVSGIVVYLVQSLTR